jgi:outer membrane protein assembly factor BamB
MNPSQPTSHALIIILSFWAIVLGLPGSIGQLRAGDWPQILGPKRSGQAVDEKPLASSWDKTAPKLLWRFPVGSGYAGAAISGGHVFLFDRDSQNERLTSVDLATGKQLWQTRWPASYNSSMDPDSGPRAVPTVAEGSVVCYGAAGDLICIDSTNGGILWQRALRKELHADDGYYGAGSSPLVVEGVVVADIVGKKGGIVGIDLKSGNTRWQATDYDASYSSPIAVDIAGTPAALVETRLRTVLVEVESGKILSEIDFGARGPTVNAATPLALGNNRFFLTASYGIGAHLIQLRGTELNREWKNVNLLASQYNSPVLIGDTIVGVHGREDLGEVLLRGIRAGEERILWEEPLPGPAHLVALGNQLLQVVINGQVRLSSVTTTELKTTAQFALPQTAAGRPSVFRALPALSRGILIVRSTQGPAQGEFIAIQLP